MDLQAKDTEHSLPRWHVWDTIFDKLDELFHHNIILGIFFAVILTITAAGATSVVTVLLVKLLAYLPPWENSQPVLSDVLSNVFQSVLFGIAFKNCLIALAWAKGCKH
jgi:hypothetical protein